MRILALESSAKAASVCVSEDGKLIGQYFQNSGLTHSRTLLPMAADLLKNLELNMADIGLVAISKGPGSFTGLRIGIATAKGLAQPLSIPCCGVSTLEALARQVAEVCNNGIICAVMDARRNQVYNALFSVENGVLARISEDRAISIEALSDEMKARNLPHFLVGDGAELCYNTLKSTDLPLVLAPMNLRFQTAFGVALAAEEGERVSAKELLPVYLRLSQAERERLEKLQDSAR